MQKLLACFFTMFLLVANPAFAHGPNGEPHPPDELILQTAQKKFDSYIPNKELVKGHYLDDSWAGTTPNGIIKRGPGYVIILFQNKQNTDQLYMLMSDMGVFLDSNTTNWFAGIE